MGSKSGRQRATRPVTRRPQQSAMVRDVPKWPTWQLARCEVRSPVIRIELDLGLRHALVEYGLPKRLARDLIETVAETSAERGRLIATAAPSYRTAGKRGRLSSLDTDRLLRVGTLFEMLRTLFGTDTVARSHLRLPLSELGERSAIDCSGSIAALDHIQSLLFSQIEIANTAQTVTRPSDR